MHFITYFGPRRGWTADEADRRRGRTKRRQGGRDRQREWEWEREGQADVRCAVRCAPQDILRILTHATEMATTRM